jgi:recA bacterial DNA recombination protein
MSSAVISTSAAQSRFFVFDAEYEAEVCSQPSAPELLGGHSPQKVASTDFREAFKDARLACVTPASRLAVRPALEMVSSGIAAIDTLTGGLPRSCLTEIFGPASSGRTTLLLAALAAATRRGEVCAVVDASDAIDPQSMAAAGIDLDRLLWVRCGEKSPPSHRVTDKKNLKKQVYKFEKIELRLAEHRLEQLLRATDLLLESGGFGLIALDLCDLPPQTAHRIPLTTWFRFRRAVEYTPTVLLAIERQSIAGSCSSLLIKLGSVRYPTNPQSLDSQIQEPAHAQLLTGLEITAEIVRSRMDRKLSQSVSATFASKTAWAG